MTTQTKNNQVGLVQEMRKVRDQISSEIKDMTFEQERAYLDKLLSDKNRPAPNSALAPAGQDKQAMGNNLLTNGGMAGQ
jgi:hypothetical protein